MANSIKQYDETPALQVTKEARSAGLAEEASGDDLTGVDRWASLADVRVYGFDEGMLVVEPDEMHPEHLVKLVATAARSTKSIYQGRNARVRPAGNGCMVSLPGLADTRLRVGDKAPVRAASNILVVTEDTTAGVRLAEALVSIRESQISDD